MKKPFNILLTLLLAIVLFTSCDSEESKQGQVNNQEEVKNEKDIVNEVQEHTGFALNTVISIRLYEAPEFSEKDWEDVFAVIDSVEQKMSIHIDDSEVSKINENAGKSPVIVSEETFKVIEKAKEIADKTGGAFNPCVGVLSAIWKIGTDDERVPEKSEIERALRKLDYNKLVLNREDFSVYLEEEGMSLDLGGIAKGYATDKVYDYLMNNKKVKSAILDFGGNISLLGSKEGKDWRVGNRKPDREEFLVYSSFFANDEAVVSSGDYERFFEKDGKIYHHILNPYTGYPVDNGIRGTTVIMKSSMEADAYATAIMVMGRELASEFIENKKLETVIVFDDFANYCTLNEKRNFRLESE